MRKAFTRIVLCFSIMVFLSFLSILPVYGGTTVSQGVLVVAHGVDDPNWTVPVWEAVYELKANLPYPVALGFLKFVGPDIPEAVEELNIAGVNKIIAVPLFISSFSNHIEEIKYILKLRETLPGEESLEQANPQGEVVLTPAIDDHSLMAEVLTEQFKRLSQDPSAETGVLAAHGSDNEEGQQGWVKNLASLAKQIQTQLAKGELKKIRSGFIFEGLTPSLREAVYEAVYTDGATALVVPVMVSEGYFTGRKIPGLLKEFPAGTYRYPEEGQRALITFKKSYANRIVEWRAANELWPRPEVQKDGVTTELTLDRCQEIARDAGKGYPCSVLAFRLAGVALPALWPDGPAAADDLLVVSLLPPEAGSKPVFDYLAGPAEVKYFGKWKKLTPLSPSFILANKATGETVFIHVKPDTFGGEDFFALRNKVVNGQASPEEQAALKARQDLLLKNLLTKPAETIFTWKKAPPLSVFSPDGAPLKFYYADLAVEEDKLCMCGSFGFRALGESFAALYKGEQPRQGGFAVRTAWATDCTREILPLVAGEGNYTLLEHKPLNAADFYYKVTDRATSRTVFVKGKPQLFPKDFFALRSKCKQGTATPEEKARFMELREQVIWSLLFKPAGEIFSVYTCTYCGEAKIIHVNETGWWSETAPEEFHPSNTPIQDATNIVNANGTVIVHGGIYKEQLYINKSIDLRAAEGDRPEIQAPEAERLKNYTFEVMKKQLTLTPLILVNGSFEDINVDISGFVIDGSSASVDLAGIAYFNANGIIGGNEIKSIYGQIIEEEETGSIIFNGNGILVASDPTTVNLTVHGNTVHDYQNFGIYVLGKGCRATVTKNTVTGSNSSAFPDQCGIMAMMSDGVTVNDNTVSSHAYTKRWWYAPGIGIFESNGSAQGNTLTDNQLGIWIVAGIETASSCSVFIEGNVVNLSGLSDVEPGGIVLGTYAWNPPYYTGEGYITATIDNNQFTGGLSTGIIIGDDSHHPWLYPAGKVTATVTRNAVSDCKCGIKLLNTSNSVIFLNDFVNNTQSIFVNKSTNTYSSPEKINYTYKDRNYLNYLGNYWSNYVGEDADEDGIGDTTYNITGDNPDYHPLMQGFESYSLVEKRHGGGGGGGRAPAADRVEKPVQAGATTVAEVPGKVKVEVPAGAVEGANAVIKAEVVSNEKAAGAGMPLLSKVVDITLKNGALTGGITITLYFDKSGLAKDQEPAAFSYDEKDGRWVRLEGTIDLEKGTVTVMVDHLTLFAVFAVSKEAPKPEAITFKDMKGHWAANVVSRLAGMGLISGYPDGAFRPDREMNRAEVAALLVRALKPAPATRKDLQELSRKMADAAAIPTWALDAAAVAVREDLVKGCPQPDGTVTFEANRPVSRVEIAALMIRVLEKKIGTVTPAELKFTDAGAIPNWAKASVGAAVAKGVIAGYPDGTFRAEKTATRAETASFVLRLLEAVGNR